MEIQKIDKNFDLRTTVDCGERKDYLLPHASFALYGVFYDAEKGRFARMPAEVAEQVSEGVAVLAAHTAGGRVCFSTDSTLFQLKAEYDYLWNMSHMPLSGSSGFTLFEETDEGECFKANFMPLASDKNGFQGEIRLEGDRMRNYVLYFPLYNDVRKLTLSLDKNARVKEGKRYRSVAPILYYGSSITQGGCANRPDQAYQAWICKWTDVDFINLGFSGNAKGEDVMVDYLASIDCSIFVCDYDHNAPTPEHLQATHYRLYERYRAKRPDTPILFISRPDYGNGDILANEKRLQIILATYKRAKKQGDDKVYFLSGKTFYGNLSCYDVAVEGCHPTSHGFYLMAKKIYKKIKEIDKGCLTEIKK